MQSLITHPYARVWVLALVLLAAGCAQPAPGALQLAEPTAVPIVTPTPLELGISDADLSTARGVLVTLDDAGKIQPGLASYSVALDGITFRLPESLDDDEFTDLIATLERDLALDTADRCPYDIAPGTEGQYKTITLNVRPPGGSGTDGVELAQSLLGYVACPECKGLDPICPGISYTGTITSTLTVTPLLQTP